MESEQQVLWTALDVCTECHGTLVKLPTANAHHTHTVTIWNGAKWRNICHGTKACKDCNARFKLNYRAGVGTEMNTLRETTLEDDTIILLHPHLGFRYSYVKQFWNRMCRANVSFLAEASTIVFVVGRN